MTTQQLQDRHEKGERILDMIKSVERQMEDRKSHIKYLDHNNVGSISHRLRVTKDIDQAPKTIARLRNYYFNTMEIVPTESIQDIAKEVARKTEISPITDGKKYQIETFESQDYRLEFEFTPHYSQGEFEGVSDLHIYELFHDRRTYTMEELDGLKMLLWDTLNRKGRG